ncbi:MAG: hypothetical protein U0L88_02000 [Acutalibacteraceae bacterium]|nr:hypothetical protein [Acutalibacteraceae bacterium]
MWVTEKYIKEKGKHAGETEERRVAGYSTSLTNLLRSFRDAKVGGSDAESLEELIEVLRATYDDMEQLYRCGVEEGLHKLKEMSKR